MKTTKLNEKQIDGLCEDYLAGMPWRDIVTKYGVCFQTVKNYLTRRGTCCNRESPEFLHHSPPSAPYIDYFHTIDTEEKAYWLGFIAADGCVIPRFGKLQLGLGRKDRLHLEAFRSAIKVPNTIRDHEVACKSGRYPASLLTVYSKGMLLDLEQLGISATKTYALQWPSLASPLERHFIRGYFDGDGCWTVMSRKNDLHFGVIGQPNFLEVMQQRLIDNCQLSATKIATKENCAAVSYFRYGGNRQCVRIANFLYRDASVFLPRKRAVVIAHYQGLPHYQGSLSFCGREPW